MSNSSQPHKLDVHGYDSEGNIGVRFNSTPIPDTVTTVGSFYNAQGIIYMENLTEYLDAYGVPPVWTVNTVPDGCTFAEVNGQLSGTLAAGAEGTHRLRMGAADITGRTVYTNYFTLTVNPA